jgi:hypothetical protein
MRPTSPIVLCAVAAAYVFLAAAPANAQGTELWNARYDGPASGHDGARAVGTDAGGNVFVTGVSAGIATLDDWATLKYDPDGNLLWESRLNGPINGNDLPQSLLVDANGDVYVTGFSLLAPGLQTITTVKYSGADGAVLWEQRVPGLANAGRIMALDSEGNVVVTGWDGAIRVVKYRGSDGEPLWSRRYDAGPGNDNPYGIAIGPDDTVYVAGTSSIGSGTAAVTLRFTSRGELEWARLSPVGTEGAAGIAVDGEGNAFTLSTLMRPSQFWNYKTVKYSPDGALLWQREYNGGGWDQAKAIALDPNGNVTATGQSQGAAGHGWDVATVQYDTNGVLRWVQRYHAGGNDFGRTIVADADGNVYVAAASSMGFTIDGGNGFLDIAAIKYDVDGNEVWVSRYDGPANASDDLATGTPSLAVSGDRVHVAGWSTGVGTFFDFVTIALANE